MNYKELGIVILLHRRDRKISQELFARQAEISRNYLSMIERGAATGLSVEILVKLARAMNDSPCVLLRILAGEDKGDGDNERDI